VERPPRNRDGVGEGGRGGRQIMLYGEDGEIVAQCN
jgi:hypothetical protein